VFTDKKLDNLEEFRISADQRINRIPHLSQLLFKKPLALLLNASQTDVGVRSWSLLDDRAELETLANTSDDQFFIVKPSVESGGTGISIHAGLSSVLKLDVDAVVQPMLSNPVLCEGRKADFRIFVLVLNGRDESYRTFLLKQGYARVAGSLYKPVSAASVQQASIYLTNDAVGRNNLPWDAILKPIEAVVPEAQMGNFISKVSVLVRDTVQAVMAAVHRLPAAPVAPEHTYQLLGFDVFASADFEHVALLEVNSKPCTGCDLDKSASLREANTKAVFASLLLGGNAGDDKLVSELAQSLSDLVVEV
jgi:hypothetical protein